MKNFLNKIKISFVNASKGLESFSVVAWGWGGLFYLVSYFIFNKLVIAINSKFFDYSLLILLTIYLVWHIYVAIRCFPKAPKLSKEEKEKLKIQNGGASRAFLRKLFLQEPITKTNSRNILIAIDTLILLHFYALIY
jgi:asparagine N-glycosylation enzyme membrane subunit Stt3